MGDEVVGRKHRIFIGLSLEKDLQRSLFVDVFKKLKTSADKKQIDVKWTRPENLHLTLKFLGELESGEIEEVKDRVAKTATQLHRFSIAFTGLGGFPEDEAARVLFMGVKQKRNLSAFQEKVAAAVKGIGAEDQFDSYVPHVTLGRLRNKKHIGDLISPFVRKDFGKVQVEKIQIFESFLQQNYPVYKVVAEYTLAEAELTDE